MSEREELLDLPPIIGFGHRKRVGKDTAAHILIRLIEQRRFQCVVRRAAFADKLKDVAHQLYGWAGLHSGDWYEYPGHAKFRDEVLRDIGKSPRQIWIDLGTPGVRKAVFDGTWVEYLLRTRKPYETLIVPDVRFPNEVAGIHEAGGIVVKIDNPRVPETSDVADDALASYDCWDWQISNDGTVAQFEDKLCDFLKRFETPCG